MAASLLADAPAFYTDRAHSVNVALMTGSLSSVSEEALLNGANAALLGDEIIQFQNASLNADGSYTLSHLVRGVRGTENATPTHMLGEIFILLQESRMGFLPLLASDRGQSRAYRGVSVGQLVGDVASQTHTHNLRTLQPFAPVHVQATRNAAGDIAFEWKRRARMNAHWLDNIDVPLDEDVEIYDVEIYDGVAVVRSFQNLSAAECLYTAAQQTSDFGVPQTSVAVKIYQISSRYGRGVAAEAVV